MDARIDVCDGDGSVDQQHSEHLNDYPVGLREGPQACQGGVRVAAQRISEVTTLEAKRFLGGTVKQRLSVLLLL